MLVKFSVCIDALYSGQDFYDSLKSVKAVGMDTIEFWSWWDGKNLEKIKTLCDELDLKIVTFCTKLISMTDAKVREDYIVGLKQSIDAAKTMGAAMIISQVGQDTNKLRVQQHQNIVDCLKKCVSILESENITLVIEPLNTVVDHIGYYLWSSDEAFEIVEEVNSPNVKVLYDIYHQQIMEGNLITRIRKNIHRIGHFHAAGNPGRHELDIGEINYPEIFKAIDETGYTGYVGLEYFTIYNVEDGLNKLKSMV